MHNPIFGQFRAGCRGEAGVEIERLEALSITRKSKDRFGLLAGEW
jgi:hypothetical protein